MTDYHITLNKVSFIIIYTLSEIVKQNNLRDEIAEHKDFCKLIMINQMDVI